MQAVSELTPKLCHDMDFQIAFVGIIISYCFDEPERQLLVKFTFFGSIPNNGFSYTDGNGKTRYYSVSQSGKDGSLIFIEF